MRSADKILRDMHTELLRLQDDLGIDNERDKLFMDIAFRRGMHFGFDEVRKK